MLASLLTLLVTVSAPSAAPSALEPLPSTVPAVAAPPESPQERDARMGWWRDARFGMFIHWGLYAVPAGEWNGQPVPGAGEWLMYSAKVKPEDYEPLIKQFNPVKFDAKRWVAIAKAAGMRYIVITSKHHDGFCLWDSDLTDWDVMSTPFKRDILKELADACREAGIRLCFYHSIMDWHHPDYLPRKPWDTRPADQAYFDRYRTYMKGQLGELLSGRYGDIGVLWFDGEWEDTWTHEFGKDLDSYVRALKKDIIINNRVDVGRQGMAGLTRPGEYGGDFGTPEQEIPATGFPGVDWETCMTMNGTWGFHKHDSNWKSPQTMVRMLCDIASKGGNFLLNVGPTAEGEIPAASVERLAEMGAWLEKNGESIYGTGPSVFASLPWGRSTTKTVDGSSTIYLHVFDWPTDGRLVVPGLLSEIRSAKLLGTGETLATAAETGNVVVSLPAAAPDPIAGVVALELAGEPKIIPPLELMPARDQFVNACQVYAKEMPEGITVRYTVDGSEPTKDSPELTAIAPRRTTSVKARAFLGDAPIGEVVERTFERLTPWKAVRRDRDPQKLRLLLATAEGQFRQVDDLKKALGEEPTFTEPTAPTIGIPEGLKEHFGLYYRGYILTPWEALFDFWLTSDDGSVLIIDDQVVINNDGLHSRHTKMGSAPLTRGMHLVELYYFEATGQETLELEWTPEGAGSERRPMEHRDFLRR